MAKKNTTQTATTAVTNPNAVLSNITLPQPEGKLGPKIETCEVGPFRLKGIKVDTSQYTDAQYKEMTAWVRENNGYVVEDKGIFSWKSEAKRDWFILRWS